MMELASVALRVKQISSGPAPRNAASVRRAGSMRRSCSGSECACISVMVPNTRSSTRCGVGPSPPALR